MFREGAKTTGFRKEFHTFRIPFENALALSFNQHLLLKNFTSFPLVVVCSDIISIFLKALVLFFTRSLQFKQNGYICAFFPSK